MTNDLITVCTATLGCASYRRLNVLLPEMRRFTSLPYRHIVCDDGTASEDAVALQRTVCGTNGVEHLVNPGPYGVSHNLNYLIEQAKTPWVYLVECGLRPSRGWLEAAMAFIEAIHGKKFAGHEVAMVGMSSLQDWCVRLGDATPTDYAIMHWWDARRYGKQVTEQFYGDWNDGFISWPRMQPVVERHCLSPEADDWYGEPMVMRNLVRQGQFHFTDYWPKCRRAGWALYPGAFMLVNVEKWREVGRMRDGCCAFEVHLGLRFGLAGHLVLSAQSPPWIHRPSQCFAASYEGKMPRDNLPDDAVFAADFGTSIVDAPRLVDAVIPKAEQAKINDLLPEVPMLAGWEKFA